MTTPPLAKARLIPFRDPPNASEPDEARAIPFDFNPETLTLKVSSGEARDAARRGRQQTQNVGASQATLSFDCQFDSTRPRVSDGPGSENASVEQRDVRRRTRAIADLLQVTEPGRKPTPRRVRFLWGSFSFDGVVSQHQEVFDYFSATGVPLRSKVSLTLTEKDFRYNVTAEQAAPLRDAAATGAGGTAAGSGTAGADGSPASPGSAAARAEAAIAAALVPGVARPSSAQIGRALGAGLPLNAGQALGLFGAAALAGGTASPAASTAGASGGAVTPPRTTPRPGQPSAPWGRDAAPAGSAAAGLAAQVVAQRQAGLDPGVAAPRPAASPKPLTPPPAISGHALLRPRLALEPDVRLFATPASRDSLALERRPRWEGVPTGRGRRSAAAAGRDPCRCGRTPCCCGGEPWSGGQP